nr:MAG TPA_asm: hypothetical protein [Microviridae sp.]
MKTLTIALRATDNIKGAEVNTFAPLFFSTFQLLSILLLSFVFLEYFCCFCNNITRLLFFLLRIPLLC